MGKFTRSEIDILAELAAAIFFVAVILLRATNVIRWSWWIILAPVLVPTVILLVIVLYSIVSRWVREKRKKSEGSE